MQSNNLKHSKFGNEKDSIFDRKESARSNSNDSFEAIRVICGFLAALGWFLKIPTFSTHGYRTFSGAVMDGDIRYWIPFPLSSGFPLLFWVESDLAGGKLWWVGEVKN